MKLPKYKIELQFVTFSEVKIKIIMNDKKCIYRYPRDKDWKKRVKKIDIFM